MIALVAEYTIRSIALGALAFLVLKTVRVKDARLERTVWRMVLVSAVSMPVLSKLSTLSPMPASVLTMNYAELVRLPDSSQTSVWNWGALVMVGAVSGLLTVRHLLGVARCWGMRRRATRLTSADDSSLDIRMSSEVSSPATVFSTVLVPPDFTRWTSEAQRLAIAHERSHVASMDFYVQWVAQIYRSVFWFNPFAWWLAYRLALLNEHVSDDAAVACRDADEYEDRTKYARVLLTLARRDPLSADVVPMIRAKTLSLRVERILMQAGARRATGLQTLLVASTLVPILAATAAIQSPTEPRSYANNLQPAQSASNGAAPVILPRSDPARPLSRPEYPPASRRLGESGTVVLKLHVIEDGTVADAAIEQTSGYADLDHAALYESFRWRLEPGTIDGAPTRMWGRFAVTFKLAHD